MKCPKCGSDSLRVITSRLNVSPDGGRCRWRHCNSCRHRWFTWQAPEVPVSHDAVRWVGADVVIDAAEISRARREEP